MFGVDLAREWQPMELPRVQANGEVRYDNEHILLIRKISRLNYCNEESIDSFHNLSTQNQQSTVTT